MPTVTYVRRGAIGYIMLNRPEASVVAPRFVPLTVTLTPGIGLPLLSTMVPVIGAMAGSRSTDPPAGPRGFAKAPPE